MKNEPLVISYLRFSRPEQAKGDSLRRQNEGPEKWCQANGHTLTERLADKGISAFRGANRKGALVAFLELVEAGTVPPGSILLVEDLDRLSRQEPEEALHLFLSIVRAGVTIVTMIDGNEYRKGQLDMPRLTMSIMRICLAHEESEKKSKRLAAAWGNKRAKIGEKVITKRLPAWLKVVEGKIVVDEAKAEIVRTMFKMANSGNGLTSICKWANQNANGLAKRSYFNRSYVFKILHNEQVIGIYQPHKLVFGTGKRREPIGEPVKNYYPAIPGISEADFYAAQSAMKSRKHTGGPSGKWVNILAGRIFNHQDDTAMVCVDKGSGRQFASRASIEGRKGAAEYISFPAIALEAAVIGHLAQGDFSAVKKDSPKDREINIIVAKFDQLQARINETAKALEETTNVAAVVKILAKMEAEAKTLDMKRKELQGEHAAARDSQPAELVANLIQKIGQLHKALDDQEQRIHLRQIVRGLAKRIDVSTSKDGLCRTASVTMTWIDGQREHFTVQTHVKNPWTITTTSKGMNSKMVQQTSTLAGHEEATALTPDKRTKIINLWKSGMGGSEIAKIMGVSVSSVYRHKPTNWTPKWGMAKV